MELRFFGGLNFDETAEVLKVSAVSVLLAERYVAGKDFAAVLAALEPGLRSANARSLRYPHLRYLALIGDIPAGGAVQSRALSELGIDRLGVVVGGSLGGFQALSFDFVADNQGLTLFHCHQQLHMDFGFMALFRYA